MSITRGSLEHCLPVSPISGGHLSPAYNGWLDRQYLPVKGFTSVVEYEIWLSHMAGYTVVGAFDVKK